MALSPLVLLDVVDQDLEAAVDAAVVQVEAEAADLERLPAAFVLSGVDAGVELLHDLIVAGEEGAVEDLGVAEVDAGLDRLGLDDDALTLAGDAGESDVEHGDDSRRDGDISASPARRRRHRR